MGKRLRIAGVLQARAFFEPSSFRDDTGQVEVTWTTGARGLRRSFIDGPYWEELEVSEAAVNLARMNNGASVLNAHSSYDLRDVIGVVERAWIQGREGRATIRFSDREDVKPIRADVKAGILRHVSVGYGVQKYEKVEEVDGVPVYRATRWTPAELSLVPIAFDDGATVRGREAEPYEVEVSEERHMPEAVRTTDTTASPDAAAAQAEQERQAQERADAEASRRATADVEAGIQRERVRIAEIQQVIRALRLDPRTADEHITAGTAADEVRRRLIAERAAQSDQIRTEQHVRIEAGTDARDKFIAGAGASLYQRAGLSQMIRDAQKSRYADHFRDVALDAGEFGAFRMLDMARESLERRGISTRGLHGDALVKRALDLQTRDAGFNTISDFAVLLETVMYKTLLASYAVTQDKWRRFCVVRSVNDFRTANFYRTGSFGKLDALGEGGEFKHKNIPDGEKVTLSVSTKGNIIGLTRHQIVNDDLGAFNDVATGLGRAAQLSIELDVFAMLKLNSGLGPNLTTPDTNPLFDATHSNIGTSGAISATVIDGSRVIMGSQKDVSGNELLDLRPAIWLGPLALGAQARILNEARYLPSANLFEEPNYCAGLFRDVVDTGQLTGTRFYLLADPAIAPVFAVAFINGVETPELRYEPSFNYDGVQWRVRLDYGTGCLDYRGAVTCPGA